MDASRQQQQNITGDYWAACLTKLMRQSYTVKQQLAYLKHLHPNEYIVICDFAENYSFILQDAVQEFHWNNAQAISHHFVIYHKN